MSILSILSLILSGCLSIKALFYEPLKYVTQFLTTQLANSVKYPNARFCANFHLKFWFLTLNTPTGIALVWVSTFVQL